MDHRALKEKNDMETKGQTGPKKKQRNKKEEK
jgi:hypothetical protein